jgi:hypothetical protein
VKVDDVRGDVTIESMSAPVSVNNVKGRLKLRTFTGESKVKKVDGGLSLSSQKALLVAQDTRGPAEVQTGVAQLKLLDHKGSVRGSSDGGLVDVKLLDKADVKLTSQSGTLIVALAAGQGANVNLTTKGEIGAPQGLDLKRTPTGRIARGQLKGKDMGTVIMSSETGDLKIRR